MGMPRSLVVPLGIGALVLADCTSRDGTATGERAEEGVMAQQQSVEAPFALGFTMDRIDGTSQALTDYKGRVVLMVNVASECGLTPQYEGLEALYREKKDEGLVILGFPANDFMGQEPGTDEEIAAFCSTEYHVTFPLFSKISVTGAGRHALYATLSQVGGEPSWNFTKYLVDRSGRVVSRIDPKTAPDDPALRAEIDRLLAAG